MADWRISTEFEDVTSSQDWSERDYGLLDPDVVDTYWERYGKPLGRGCHRVTFAHPDGQHVLKVAINEDGMLANAFEASPSTSLPVAKGIVWNEGDTNVLMQERIVRLWPLTSKYGDPLNVDPETGAVCPDWSDLCDGGQFGWTSSGDLVAYDVDWELSIYGAEE